MNTGKSGERGYFVFYRHFKDTLQPLQNKGTQLALFDALAAYYLDGEEPDFSDQDRPQTCRAIWKGLVFQPRSRSGPRGTRRYFAFFEYYRERLQGEDVDESSRLALYWALVLYGLDEKEPDFSGVENVDLCVGLWYDFLKFIRGSWKNYKNGVAGGAPVGNQNARKQPKNNPNTTV